MTIAGVAASLVMAAVVPVVVGEVEPFPPAQQLDSYGALSPSALDASIIDLSASVIPVESNVISLRLRVEPVQTERRESGERVVSLMSDVLFDFGSASVREPGRRGVVTALVDVPDGARLYISGHTDSIGSAGANQRLSDERAAAVAGIVKDERPDLELVVEGFGETRPVADNEVDGRDNPEGREKNRRVEFRVDG